MTNLLIAYPDIPAAAITYRAFANVEANAPNASELAPIENLWTLRRSLCWLASYDLGDHYIEFDLGDGNARSANFIAFARLDRLCGLAATVGYYLDARNDLGDPWTTIDHYGNPEDSAGVNSIARVGGRGTDDYLHTFAASPAYRYWRLHLDSINGANFQARLSKLFFGSIMDLAQEPDKFNFTPTFARSGSLRTTSDNIRIVRASNSYLDYEVTWEWVSDARTELFYSAIVNNRETRGLFLYSTSFHPVLRDKRLLYAQLIDEKTTFRRTDLNTLSCKFRELLG